MEVFESKPLKKIPMKGSTIITLVLQQSIHSCVEAIANRGQWEQGCSLLMATDLGPVRAKRRKKNKVFYFEYKVI